MFPKSSFCVIYITFKVILQFTFLMEPLTETLTKCRTFTFFNIIQ